MAHLVAKNADGQHTFHLDVAGVQVELSVYEPPELHIVRYSSVDGQPIDRMPMWRLAALL